MMSNNVLVFELDEQKKNIYKGYEGIYIQIFAGDNAQAIILNNTTGQMRAEPLSRIMFETYGNQSLYSKTRQHIRDLNAKKD